MSASKLPKTQTAQDPERAVREFLELAAPIILGQKDLDADAHAALTDLAGQVGLGEQQLRSELDRLERSGIIRAPQLPRVTPSANQEAPAADTPDRPAEKPPSQSTSGPPPPPPAGTAAADPVAQLPPDAEPPLPKNLGRPDRQPAPPPVADAEAGPGVDDGLADRIQATDSVKPVYIEDSELFVDTASDYWSISPPDDDRLSKFYESVTPVIARCRGITPESRVLIGACARDHGLTDVELDEALKLLQRQYAAFPADESPEQRERRNAFRSYLRQSMAKLPNRILTLSAAEKLASAGEQFHGVAKELIHPTIRQVALEMCIRFVSEEQAVDHITRLIESKMSEATWLNQESRSGIYSEGTQWGLTPMQIEAIIHERASGVARKQARRYWLRRALIVSVGAIVVVLVPLVAWKSIGDRLAISNTMEKSSPKTESDSGRGEEVVPAAVAQDPVRWWDTDLTIAMANARIAFSELAPILDRIKSGDEAARSESYQLLVAKANELFGGEQSIDALAEVVGGAFASDPSEACATGLMQEFLGRVPVPGPKLPEQGVHVAQAQWTVAAVLGMLPRANLTVARRADLVEMLQQKLNTTLDGDSDPSALSDQCLAALAMRLYDVLAAAAEQQPQEVEQLYPSVSSFASQFLDVELQGQLDASYLAAILPHIGEDWRNYRELIRIGIDSDDTTVVLSMLNTYLRAKDPALQGYMSAHLVRRVEILPESLAPRDVARAVRQSLGIPEDPTGAHHRESFREEVRPVLDRARAAYDNQADAIRQAVQLSYYGALASVLVRDPLGQATYDDLRRTHPVPDLQLEPDPIEPAATHSLDHSYRERLRRFVIQLGAQRRSNQRVGLLRQISQMAGFVDEIDSDTGRRLARYYMSPKSDDEHAAMLDQSATIFRWQFVRLGLSDELAEANGRDQQIAELLTRVLDEQLDLSGPDWAARVSDRLRRGVAQELTPRDLDAGLGKLADRAGREFVKHYRIQAKARALELPVEFETAPPSQALEALIAHVAQRLGERNLRREDKQWLADLTFQMAANDYQSRNDLQRTVLLQRTWSRLRVAEVAAQAPELAASAESIVAQLQQFDASAPDLTQQLLDGQSVLLRLWMLELKQ